MSEAILRRIWQAIKRWRYQALALALLFGFVPLGWSSDSSPDRTAEQSFMSRAEIRQRSAVTVRAAVLTDDESQRYFGASLADHGIQAIWLGVDNASESQLEFLPIVTDPEYFSEAEVEQLLHAWWHGSANTSIKATVAEEGGLKLFSVGFEWQENLVGAIWCLAVFTVCEEATMVRGSKVFRPADVSESNASGYPDPFREGQRKRYDRRLGEHAGLKNYGVNLIRVLPGGQSSARHAHSKQDEFVYVLEGEFVLVTDAGRETVGQGTCIGFPAGTGDGHHFLNLTQKDAVFLVIGDRTAGDEVTYPDIDLELKAGPDGVRGFHRKDGTPYPRAARN